MDLTFAFFHLPQSPLPLLTTPPHHPLAWHTPPIVPTTTVTLWPPFTSPNYCWISCFHWPFTTICHFKITLWLTWLPLKHLGSGSGSSRTLWLYHDLIQCYNDLIKSLQGREYHMHIVHIWLEIFFPRKTSEINISFFAPQITSS